MRPKRATIRTCRLSRIEPGPELDLGRVVHEVEAGEWFAALPDVDVEDEEAFAVELWLESAEARWPLDERVVPRRIVEALVEDRLDELIAAATCSA